MTQLRERPVWPPPDLHPVGVEHLGLRLVWGRGPGPCSAMRWFHGSTHRLAPGEVLAPGAAPANYPATEGAAVVFVTDRRDEAWDWAGFAAEMNGSCELFVYEVAPAGDPVAVEAPELHADGSPYSEFTCAAATVLAVLAGSSRIPFSTG